MIKIIRKLSSTTNKHGQSGIEFIVTYGWALLIVMLVGGGLYYYGSVNPDFLKSEKCNIMGNIECRDFSLDQQSDYSSGNSLLKLYLKNRLGKPIRILLINATPWKDKGYDITCINDSRALSPKGYLLRTSEAENFYVKCDSKIPDFVSKERFKVKINFYFNNTYPEYNYTFVGEILATVQ